MKKLRVIQIGTGNWGFSWLEKVMQSPAAELAAVVDANPDMLKIAAEKYELDPEKCFCP